MDTTDLEGQNIELGSTNFINKHPHRNNAGGKGSTTEGKGNTNLITSLHTERCQSPAT